MSFLKTYLNSKNIQRVLSRKPGDEGFSLVELVVVIAVLAILSAVAIPAFQGVQERAKTSAVKNGLTNGIKECIVKYGLDGEEEFDDSQAFKGNYTGYNIVKLEGDTCFAARATPTGGKTSGLPRFEIVYDNTTGIVEKECEWSEIGCDEGGDPPW